MTQLSNKSIEETYGEVPPSEFKKLYPHLQIADDSVFYDLGSGKGQVVLEVFLHTPVKKACGIECLSHLHALALEQVKQIDTQALSPPWQNRELCFLQGSFFELDFSDASHVFINALCFGQSFLLKLVQKLHALPKLQFLISSRPLPEIRLTCKKIIRLECSWDSTLFYIYTY